MSTTRVLFVDDDALILRGLAKALRRRGGHSDMVFAAGGPAALEEMRQTTFDVVISDMRMPEIDGAELLAHVSDRDPMTIRMILSGFSSGGVDSTRPIAHQHFDKPCDLNQLSAAIDRARAVRRMCVSEPVRAVVGRVKLQPPPPAMYYELGAMLRRKDVSPDASAAIIGNEPAIAARVLELASSPYFKLDQPATSLPDLAARLGLEMIAGLVLLAHASAGSSGSSLHEVQQHSLRIAERARRSASDPEVISQAFTAGLVHHIGEILIGNAMPDEYAAIQRRVARGARSSIVERAELGTTFAAVGAYQLVLWGAPLSIIDAVAWYEDESAPATEIAIALRAAHG